MGPTMINWAEATLLAGKGFGVVFLVLGILAVITWLIGLVFQRLRKRQKETKSAAEAEEKAKN